MRKRDGATTPPLNPSGNEWIEPSNTDEGAFPRKLFSRPLNGRGCCGRRLWYPAA